MYGEDKRKGSLDLRAMIDSYGKLVRMVKAYLPVLGDTSGVNTGDQNLSGLALKGLQVTAQTLLAANWVLSGGIYQYDLANANITALSIVDVIPNNASIATTQAAELLPSTLSSAGSVRIYSTYLATGSIVVTLNIWN